MIELKIERKMFRCFFLYYQNRKIKQYKRIVRVDIFTYLRAYKKKNGIDTYATCLHKGKTLYIKIKEYKVSRCYVLYKKDFKPEEKRNNVGNFQTEEQSWK